MSVQTEWIKCEHLIAADRMVLHGGPSMRIDLDFPFDKEKPVRSVLLCCICADHARMRIAREFSDLLTVTVKTHA